MRKTLGLLFVLVVTLPLSQWAASSFFPEFFHIYHPVVGHWAKYSTTDFTKETATVTFAVVSEEKGTHWLEVTSEQEGDSGTVAYQVSGDPTQDANVLKIRVQQAGAPPIELDRDTLQKLARQGGGSFGVAAKPIGPISGKLHPKADEVLEVAGKKITCQHMVVISPDGKEGEVWINEEVAPFGLVKLVSGEEKIELLDFGKGAKPVVTGTPVPLRLE